MYLYAGLRKISWTGFAPLSIMDYPDMWVHSLDNRDRDKCGRADKSPHLRSQIKSQCLVVVIFSHPLTNDHFFHCLVIRCHCTLHEQPVLRSFLWSFMAKKERGMRFSVFWSREKWDDCLTLREWGGGKPLVPNFAQPEYGNSRFFFRARILAKYAWFNLGSFLSVFSLDRNKEVREILGAAKSITEMKEICMILKIRIQVRIWFSWTAGKVCSSQERNVQVHATYADTKVSC